MATLTADCPRCRASKTTFDVLGQVLRHVEYGWQHQFEVPSVCRHCHKVTILYAEQLVHDRSHLDTHNIEKLIREGIDTYRGSLNDCFSVEKYISVKDHVRIRPPEHLPPNIDMVFAEGTACQSIECFNAAGTMYRLCLDLATRDMLPAPENQQVPQPNTHQRRNLKPRLDWLFDGELLPEALRELSDCVREEGNDGAHAGNLQREDADDLLDFTIALLERIYTEPTKIAQAKERRARRRGP